MPPGRSASTGMNHESPSSRFADDGGGDGGDVDDSRSPNRVLFSKESRSKKESIGAEVRVVCGGGVFVYHSNSVQMRWTNEVTRRECK